MSVGASWNAVLKAVSVGKLKQKENFDSSMLVWNKEVAEQAGWCHFLQSAEWAYVKSKTSWNTRLLKLDISGRSRAIVLYARTVPGLGRIHYLPKLSSLKPREVSAFTLKLQHAIRRGVAIRLELDQPFSPALHKALLAADWLPSPPIQYADTVLLDLEKSSEDLFKSFKKRARWEINAANRRGVVVERVECTPEKMRLLFNMLRITSKRANFRTRNQKFSKRYWELYDQQNEGMLYIARHGQDILSAAYIIKIGSRGYYKDGASMRQKSTVFASRFMHWFIMQDLQKLGCTVYDMCGVVPSSLSDDKNKGIYLFKTGFAEPVKLQGGYILPLTVNRYKTWKKIEPQLVKFYLTLYRDLWY